MRVLHVSWEYPPIVYGGLGRHVQALAEAQAARGDDVVVLTQGTGAGASWDRVNGVDILRVPHDPPDVAFREETLLAWVLGMQTAMIRAGAGIAHVDVIHAHDWVSAHASITLRSLLPQSTLVATIHATEAGRHQGWLPSPLSDAIHGIEHWLVHESDRVIVCSRHMRREVEQLFGVPPVEDRIEVIANGIDLGSWRTTRARAMRARDAHASTGPLIAFVGRLEWEKGAHTLIDALPRLRRRIPGLRAVIAGRGGHAEQLQRQARARRVSGAVDFVGWLPEPGLHALIAAADALVVPSLYEPFGLVGLEGAALGTPLVVARTGGLAEFVIDGVTGRTFAPGDPAALSDAVAATLAAPPEAQRMAKAARERLRRDYAWAVLADATDGAYEQARRVTGAQRHGTSQARIPDRSVNLLQP